MNDKSKTFLVRGVVVAFVLGIFAYIFWPASGETEIADTPRVTTGRPTKTTAPKPDEPCLVLFQRNTANVVDGSGVCISVFAEKYVAGTYYNLTVVCRASADGNAQDRQLLSDNRANKVKLTLVEKGVPVASIHAVSLGDSQPLTGSGGTDGKVMNRSCIVSGDAK